jgi:hypothetical protein
MKMMKSLLVVFLFAIGVCNGQEKITELFEKSKFSYTGFINENIPIALDLTILGDHTVFGEIKYLKAKHSVPIKIVGTFNVEIQNVFLLREFEKNGNISGIINGKLKDQKFTGEWLSAVYSDTNYPIDLTLKKHSTFKPAVLTINNIEGEYVYHYGDTGFDGVIKIIKEETGTYAYSIVIGTGGVRKIKQWKNSTGKGVIVENGQCIIKMTEACKFMVTFYNGFLKINPIDMEDDPFALSICGFVGNEQDFYLKIQH